MLMFYLPIIIFNAMLEATMKQKNVSVSIDEQPSFD
jgi:hypothetical protein